MINQFTKRSEVNKKELQLPKTVSNKLLHKLNLKLMLTAELRSGCFATYNKAY